MARNVPNMGFMASPLVLWVQTFSKEPLSYADLLDASFLNNVMLQIDPNATKEGIISPSDEVKDRIHNWDILLKNITTFYQDMLQQLILMKIPDIIAISRHPHSDDALTELEKVLLLLLGCAIQCDHKEDFVTSIKQLPLDTQHDIVDFIKEITDDMKNVFYIEMPHEETNELARHMHTHLVSLVKDRDHYIQEIRELSESLEEMCQSQQQQKLACPITGSPDKQEKQHLTMELAESKAKIRKLRQQLEEKSEQVSELQEEMAENKSLVAKLRSDNLDLAQDARAAKTYRDELDILKEKASRVTRFEAEIAKYKDKLNELEFYKARVEELREDNNIILETKSLLEDQLDASEKRAAMVSDLESSISRYKTKLNESLVECDESRLRISELMEENAKLEMEKKNSFNESVTLEEELQQSRLQANTSVTSNSICDQLNETAHARVLRLELENQRLQKQLEQTAELRQRADTLEREKKDKTPGGSAYTEQLNETRAKHELSEKRVQQLEDTVARLQGVQKENVCLVQEAEQLRTRIKTAADVSVKLADAEQVKQQLTSNMEQLQRTLKEVRTEHSDAQLQLHEALSEGKRLLRSVQSLTTKVQDAEKEVHEMETQNVKLSASLEQARVSMRKLDALEKAHATLEVEHERLARDKAAVERDNNKLKQSLESRDVSLDEATANIEELTRLNKNLKKVVDKSTDTAQKIRDLEKDNLGLVQQLGVNKKTLTTLREDLVNEKIKSQNLSNDLEKVTEELEKVGLNREKLLAIEQTEDESKYKALENMMEDAFRQSMEIKEQKVLALTSRLEESRNRNMKLQDELKNVRQQFEAFQQRSEEERPLRNSHDRNLSSGKDFLHLKDHLVKVERANATLEAENRHLQDQMCSLQTRIQHADTENGRLQQSYSAMQGQHAAQQMQLAKLQVENTTLQSQNSSVTSQNALLQQQHTTLECEHEELRSARDELVVTHESLVADHDALQQLHKQLSSEYEALISEHGSLKANHKSMKNEYRELQEQQMILLREKDDVSELRASLEKVKDSQRSMAIESLQADKNAIEAENLRLRVADERTQEEWRDLVGELKGVKSEHSELQQRHTVLQNRHSECKQQLSAMEVEVSKLATKYELIEQLNTKLEEENRALMMQLQALLTQNQDLLTQSLESKDHFHEEQRIYLEKLSGLRRQKEKLEEKIMEQYKRYDPVKHKNRGFGANLVQKAKAIIRRRGYSRERATADNSPENSSFGSVSDSINSQVQLTSYQTKSGRKQQRQRRNSAENILDSPKLARQNKALAKSTTALLAGSSDSNHNNCALRGAKSTENLDASLLPSDRDSLSSGNGSALNNEWPTRSGRRRQLQESSQHTPGYRCQSSVSSEETSHVGLHSRESSLDKHSNDVSVENEDDGLLTLDQFLQECNKSPASRRKLVKKSKKSKTVMREKSRCETKPLSPTLGPRSATRSEVPRPKSAMSRLITDNIKPTKTSNSLNMSGISQISSSSSIGRESETWRKDSSDFTSTPKYSTFKPDGTSNSLSGRVQSESMSNSHYQPYDSVANFASDCAVSHPQSPPFAASYPSFSQDGSTECERPATPKYPAMLSQEMPAKLRMRREGPVVQSPLRTTSHQQTVSTPQVHIPTIPFQRKPSLIESRRDIVNGLSPITARKPDTRVMAECVTDSRVPAVTPSRGADNIGSYNAHTRQIGHTRKASSAGDDDEGLYTEIGHRTQDLSHRTHSMHRTQDVGHRTQDTVHRTQEIEQRPQNGGHRPQDTSHRTHDTVPRSQETGLRTQDTTLYPQNTIHRPQDTIQRTQEAGHRPQDTVHMSQGTGHMTQDTTHRTQESDGTYNPGNVRSLVLNYQQCVRGHDSPVAPPRHQRPMSAGPAPASPPSPSRRPHTPGPERSPRRTLPPTPVESGVAEVKPNSVWYEYGCL